MYEIKKLLLELGVAPNVKGYNYLATAISAVIAAPEKIDQVTKVLYPEVAGTYKATTTRVERALPRLNYSTRCLVTQSTPIKENPQTRTT